MPYSHHKLLARIQLSKIVKIHTNKINFKAYIEY